MQYVAVVCGEVVNALVNVFVDANDPLEVLKMSEKELPKR